MLGRQNQRAVATARPMMPPIAPLLRAAAAAFARSTAGSGRRHCQTSAAAAADAEEPATRAAAGAVVAPAGGTLASGALGRSAAMSLIPREFSSGWARRSGAVGYPVRGPDSSFAGIVLAPLAQPLQPLACSDQPRDRGRPRPPRRPASGRARESVQG